MRASLLLVVSVFACATGSGNPATREDDTRTSVVSTGDAFPSFIGVQAGTVRLIHMVSNGRLRATTLKGLDPANQHLEYRWTTDGAYEVEVSGRYEHTVLGAVVSGGRIESRLVYRVLPDSLDSLRLGSGR